MREEGAYSSLPPWLDIRMPSTPDSAANTASCELRVTSFVQPQGHPLTATHCMPVTGHSKQIIEVVVITKITFDDDRQLSDLP